jgi:CubicO group peptidase (beta-lactamase class C family)
VIAASLAGCLAVLPPRAPQARESGLDATPDEPTAILPRTREGLDRMREVEADVAWARVRVRGQGRATLEERMAAYRVRGLSVAVVRDFRIEWAKGYGWADVDAGRRVTAQTLFEPGSISKALNAVGVLALAGDGRVDLHADVNGYLRSWKFPHGMLTKGRPVTLAAILSHTAGLSVRGFWGYRPGDALPTVAQILDGAPPARNDPVRSLFPPGVRFRYSGGGTMISQQVVMDVTRQPYADFMRARVLAPLGMTSSFFTQPPPPSAVARLATGYGAAGAPIPGRYPVMPEQAAAGLWTTAADLARFLVDVQRALRGEPGPIVGRAQAELMSTPALPGAPGLGLFVLDTGGVRYVHHGAGNAGMSGQLIGSVRGGLGVVVLQNGESPELLDEVVRTVARVYRWPVLGSEPAPGRPVASVPTATLDRYVGAYRGGDAVVSIVRRGDALWLHGPGAPRRMFFTSTSGFFTQESLSDARFLVDGAGAVTGLALVTNGAEVARARRVPAVSLAAEAMRRYAGTYSDGRGDPVRVRLHDGALWLDGGGGVVRRMSFLSESEFFTVEDFGVGMRVATTASGRVTGIWQTFGEGQRVFLRRVSR